MNRAQQIVAAIRRWWNRKDIRLTDTGSGWINRWATNRVPNKDELIRQYQGIAFACASINASTFASTPYHLYVETRSGQPRARCKTRPIDGDRAEWLRAHPQAGRRFGKAVEVEEVEEHPLLTLLDQVNAYLDGFALMELTDLYQEVEGNAYWYVERQNGGGLTGLPVAIWILPSQQVEVKGDGDQLIAKYEYGTGVNRQTFKPEQVIHFRFGSLTDPYRKGLSPLQAAWQNVLLLDQAYAHETAQLENRARPDILVAPEETLGIGEGARLEKRISSKFRRGGAGGVMVLEDAVKVTPLTFAPKDLEALASRRASREEVANIFGVPMPMLSTDTNLANMQAARELHARNAILPRTMRFDQIINQKLIPLYDPSGRLFFAHDNPVPEDEVRNLAIENQDLTQGVRTVNEVRSERGLEPVEWGDLPWLPFSVSQPGSSYSSYNVQPNDEEENPEEKHVHKHTGKVGERARRLPRGGRLQAWLKDVFREQRVAVLQTLTGKRVKRIGDVDLSDWTPEMVKRAYPIIELYADEGARATLARIGLTVDDAAWNVQLPQVRTAIEQATFRFCEATNATTSMELNAALAKLREEIAAGMIEGDNTLYELTKRVEGVFDHAERYRAERIATTEASRATHEGQYLAAKESDLVVGFKWLLSPDACELCQAVAAEHPEGISLDGQFFHDDYSGGPGRYPPLHPNCALPGTHIVATGLQRGFAAAYDGPAVEIVIASGRKLRVTANDLLLTPNGFVAASSLREGDEVIYHAGIGRADAVLVVPDDDWKPTPIEQVVTTLAEAGSVTPDVVPIAPEDFHGDAASMNGYVHIVTPDGELSSDADASVRQCLRQQSFAGADSPIDVGVALIERGDLAAMLFALRDATEGGMGGRGELLTFSRRHASHPQAAGFAPTAARNSSFAQDALDDSPRHAMTGGDLVLVAAGNVGPDDPRGVEDDRLRQTSSFRFRADANTALLEPRLDRMGADPVPLADLLARFSGQIAPTRILQVNQFHYVGSVFEVETESNLYLAEGVVKHNCMCTVTEVLRARE